MSKVRAKHAKCAVVDCKDPHKSILQLPVAEDRRAEWLQFIFNSNVPDTCSKHLHVCANHFVPDSFYNFGQYQAGLAVRLHLKEGAVPTIRNKSAAVGDGSSGSLSQLSSVRDVACQTDHEEKKSVGTQLSKRTLQNHIRSTATQVQVSSRDCGVCTLTFPLDSPLLFLQPTITERPSKRPRLSLPAKEEDPSEYSLCTRVEEPHHSI